MSNLDRPSTGNVEETPRLNTSAPHLSALCCKPLELSSHGHNLQFTALNFHSLYALRYQEPNF